MKTSEFREYLKENWGFTETKDLFILENLMIISKITNKIEFLADFYLSSKGIITLVKTAIEYASTPLEEREEEKKYRLSLSDYFHSSDFMGMYLNLNTETSEYTFNDSSDGVNGYKTHFTQKEIDAMPFDTNFFIKEEVK